MPVPAVLRSLTRPSLRGLIVRSDAAIGRLSGYRWSLLRFLPGTCPVVLHLTGRRSGEVRHTTLLGVRESDRIFLVGSNWGQPVVPAWVHNLRASGPRVEATVRGHRGSWRWRELAGAERAHAWQAVVREWPAFEDYAVTAHRLIPVFGLEPE